MFGNVCKFLTESFSSDFATLSQTNARRRTLEEVAQVIEAINDTRIRSNVAASTAVLAGLVLNKDAIKRIL